jgi:hypothetical protein
MKEKLAFCILCFIAMAIPTYADYNECQIKSEKWSCENVKSLSAKSDECQTTEDCEKIKEVEMYQLINKVLYNTKATISVGATDYSVGDEALVHAKVDENFEPVFDAFCDYQIFYPNRTLFTAGSMDLIGGSRGLYVDNFTIPNVVGVYPIDVVCVKPTESYNQTHYFRRDQQHEFKNSTGSTTETITFIEIEPDVGEQCYVNWFTELPEDFDNGEFKSIRFLDYIFDISGWWEQDGGSADYDLIYKFYRVTDFGQTYLGSAIASNVEVDDNPQEFNFSDVYVGFPFTADALLQTEVCARKLNGGGVDLYFYYNSSTRDSQFTVASLGINATTLDFEIGSSSELNVKLSGGSQTVNLTESFANISTDVWNFPDRNLTYYNLENEFGYLDEQLENNFSYIINQNEDIDIGILNNFTYIDQNIQSNFTFTNSLIDNIESLINALESNMNGNFTFTNNLILSMNTTLFDHITNINTSINTILTNIENQLDIIEGKIDDLDILITNITVGNVSVSVDLSTQLLNCEPEYDIGLFGIQGNIKRLYCFFVGS